MSRLSSVDAFWINAEAVGPPFAIGALVILDGPAPPLQELRELLAARAITAQRLRQRLVPDQLRIRQASWQDAEPDFEHHVVSSDIGPDADQDAVEQEVGRIMRRPMDRSRPLWDFTIITGLADERWAAVCRVHHTVADGQGALLLIGNLIDTDPAGTTSLTAALDALMKATAPGGDDGGDTGTGALLADAAKRGGDLVLRALRTATSASATTQALSAARDQAQTLATQAPRSPGILAGDPGEPRSWHMERVPLSDVKRVKSTLGGTVNDVVMTLMSGGFRALVQELGSDPDPLAVRVLVPVSLRSPGDLASNNQVSGLLVMLPLAGGTVSRYDDIKEHLNAVKNLGTAPLALPFYEAIDRTVPAFVQTFAVSALSGAVGAAFVETLVTNVPGPQFPVYLAGRQARTMAPLIPLGEPFRLNTGVTSYDGELQFGFTGGEGIGDLVRAVGAGVQQAMADLLAAADAAPRR